MEKDLKAKNCAQLNLMQSILFQLTFPGWTEDRLAVELLTGPKEDCISNIRSQLQVCCNVESAMVTVVATKFADTPTVGTISII